MKYTAIFLKRTSKMDEKLNKNPNYDKVGKAKFKVTNSTVEFKEKSYMIYIDLFAFYDGNERFYFYDFDTGDLINFDTLVKSGINPRDLNKFTGQKTVEQIVAGAKANANSSLLMIILPIITLIIGIVVGHFIAPSVVTVAVPVTPTVPSV